MVNTNINFLTGPEQTKSKTVSFDISKDNLKENDLDKSVGEKSFDENEGDKDNKSPGNSKTMGTFSQVNGLINFDEEPSFEITEGEKKKEVDKSFGSKTFKEFSKINSALKFLNEIKTLKHQEKNKEG